MNTDKLAKLLFYTLLIGSLFSLTLFFGMWSGATKTRLYWAAWKAQDSVRTLAKEVEETSILRPHHLLQPARYEGSGVTINDSNHSDELILLSGFFEDKNEIQLIERDGTLIQRWPLSFKEIFPDPSFLPSAPASDWNVDTHGALALPDGSIVFNFDYCGSAKLSLDGSVEWAFEHQTHHSIERAEGGGFWVPGQRTVEVIPSRFESPFPPFQAPFVESTLVRLSDSGDIIREISVPEIFYVNNLEALLSSKAAIYDFTPLGKWNREIVHLNNIAELSSSIADDFPLFEAGDLALSMRDMNLVMVISPETLKVKWWRIGPWIRQHDPEFSAGGKIVVFNNNAYLNVAFGDHDRTTKHTSLEIPRVSNIIEIDPVSNEYSIAYGSREGQEMLSVSRGKVDVLSEGRMMITEFDGGRVFEVDDQGQVTWQFINRYDDDEVAEITEARVYPRSYFTVEEWDL